MKFVGKISALRTVLDYKLPKRELIMGVLECLFLLCAAAVLFFNNIKAAFLMLPYMHFFLKGKEKSFQKKYYDTAAKQFKDGMLAVSSSLAAGYSVENAFKEAVSELINLYGEKSIVVEEFKTIVRKLSLNENVEDAMCDMAEKIKLEDAVYFAQVFRFAKRSGGNLIEIIGKTASNIGDKLSVLEEISVLISAKQMEQKIMNIMPFGIIAYLRICAYEFIAPLYGNLFGVCVMTVCLLFYLAAIKLSQKIMDIKV